MYGDQGVPKLRVLRGQKDLWLKGKKHLPSQIFQTTICFLLFISGKQSDPHKYVS